jgi:hypothetical protein
LLRREASATSVLIEVRNPKFYSSHERACRYGQVRGASPIDMLDSTKGWVALPFFGADGRVNLYKEVI